MGYYRHATVFTARACDSGSSCRDLIAEAIDPPDAPDDAAVFMHDLSHGAWHMFTKHVAKEAASMSGSSAHYGEGWNEVRKPHPVA